MTDAAIGSPTAGQTPENSTIAPDKDAVKAASIGTRPPAQHESHPSVNLALRRSYRSSTKRPAPDKDEGAARMLGAIAFEVTGKGNEADNALGGSEDSARDTEIAGTGDCVPYLAMVSLPGTPLLRPPKLAASKTVGKPVGKSGPKSRAECERRCGAQGFCDASSDLGCGGIYCGRRNDGV